VAATAALLVAPMPFADPVLGTAEARCAHATDQPAELSKGKARAAIACLINARRAARGQPPLSTKRAPREAALRHTRRMIRRSCFSHRCPGERDLAGRLRATAYLPCDCTWLVGENIAWGEARMGTPAAIVRAWMRSPSHRANILTRKFEHLGVGVARGRPGADRDGGSATYTTDFGYKG
jgi:uncharacterized protein YkwD